MAEINNTVGFNELVPHANHLVTLKRYDDVGNEYIHGDLVTFKCETCNKVIAEFYDEINTVTCKFCYMQVPEGTAVRHYDNGYVGECCMDQSKIA